MNDDNNVVTGEKLEEMKAALSAALDKVMGRQ